MANRPTVRWDGPRVAAEVDGHRTEAVQAAVDHLLGVAQDQTPHEEGTLERSGRAVVDGNGRGSVSFDTPYAMRQHEEMTWQHPGKGKAKYLEDPFNSEAGTMRDLMAAVMRRALR